MDNFSVYIHVPFCTQRCGYCDFNTYAGLLHLVGPYVDAVCQEILMLQQLINQDEFGEIGTVYFGGGTPSLLAPTFIQKLISQLKKSWVFSPDIEITLEVNPGTVDAGYLNMLHEIGVNRLSLGVQSSHKKELEVLDRLHGYDEAVRAIEISRSSGFKNISLDFIYGIPFQQIEDWEETLSAALKLSPEHLSLYALSVEPGTLMEQKVLENIYPMPDEDTAADMYENAMSILENAGYSHYEISNWAKLDKERNFESRHNLQYWRNLPYVGLGAGAHGYIGSFRTVNENFPSKYIQYLKQEELKSFPQTPATVDLVKIDKYREMQETMMMGLRLLDEGVSEILFKNRFGLALSDVFEKEINRLCGKGLVIWDENQAGDRSLKLSKFGYFLANQVFQEFI